jgi:hypothetical protein
MSSHESARIGAPALELSAVKAALWLSLTAVLA